MSQTNGLTYSLGEAKLALLSGVKFGDVYPFLSDIVNREALKFYFVHGESPASSCSLPKPLPDEELREAVQQGFTGNVCHQCGGSRMRRNGTCEVCEECGSTSGCS